MSRLKDQEIYLKSEEADIRVFRIMTMIAFIIFIASIVWHQSFIGDFLIESGGILVISILAWNHTSGRIKRLRAAQERGEYILEDEFSTTSYDKDGNEIDQEEK